MNHDEQWEKVCSPQFNGIHSKLDSILSSLDGNGQPGLKTRIATLEATMKWVAGVVFLMVSGMITIWFAKG